MGTSTAIGLVVAIALLGLIMVGSIYLAKTARRVRIKLMLG